MALRAAFAVLLLALGSAAAETRPHWVGSWACSPQLAEPANRPPVPSLAGFTLRQIVQVSCGGRSVRLRLSNEFGETAISLTSVHLARSAGDGAIDPATDQALTFSGAPAVMIPGGAPLVSDPLDFDLAAGAEVAITLRFANSPRDFTAHPGSRATSFLQQGEFVSAAALPAPLKTDHWYFIAGLDVRTEIPSAGAIVILGDSITDGRGSTTNGNDRWTDRLARRLSADGSSRVSVLNEGIGGNRLLREGLGPNALARFDRDVIAQAGVRWLIVFEGINDLGTAVAARSRGEPAATARDVIGAYRQCILRAHAHGIRVFGATLTPFAGFTQYYRPESEADRQEINRWIRGSGQFDAVIDFDAAARDPSQPSRLAPANDSGDHLHLNPAGYERMAQAVDLALFRNP